MKRRTFCHSTLAALAAASLPQSIFAAAAESLGPVTQDIPAVRGDGAAITLARAEVEELRRSLRGILLTHADHGYEDARQIWNAAFDRRPALIVRCAGASDVAQAVNFARTHSVLTAVRAGGHSLSGQSVCDDGLVIDLTPMRGIRVDPRRKIAHAQAGCLLGDLDRKTQFYGLATTAGTVTHTGLAGLTLGGGTGRLARKFGLSCDQLRSVDVVTANGELVTASEEENADLFWGVRGGGGNFGVVTALKYRLHDVGPRLVGGMLAYPFAQAPDVLLFLSEFMASAPDELWFDAITTAPRDGQRAFVLDACYSGAPNDAERVFAPLLKAHPPIRNMMSLTKYVDLQRSHDVGAMHGQRSYVKSGYAPRIDRALIADAFERFERPDVHQASLSVLTSGGGAVSHTPSTATAFARRQSTFSILLRARWKELAEQDASIAWARKTWRALEPFTDGFYSNTTSMDDPSRDADKVYGANLPRLVALKRKYDPNNLFRLNANIDPNASVRA